MNKIITLNNYVILKQPTYKTNKSKLIIHNNNKPQKTTGIIKYISKNKYNLKKNDTVYFDKYSVIKIKINNKKYLCIKLTKLICKHNEK
ncbi:hypothetical protein JSR02_00575 [Candidatus Vidania fulgoroideae]|uniref:10 kDa chaperonin n=1 Tax=Candidatus Vidania fulgoroideorum TaxID=881286 RepID=A0A975AEG6_9PROT|nr:hypothetical protein JSR02_00575 [Candidatus Vidania fulgoroideae]